MFQVSYLMSDYKRHLKSFLKRLSILRVLKVNIINTIQILYYIDLICEKIDLHVDAFVKRIGALRKGDLQTVEFIEKMMLSPLNWQINYLAGKLSKILNK